MLALLGGSACGSSPSAAAASWWRPAAGIKYQIQLKGALDDQIDAPVYIIDLFDNSAAAIRGLQAKGRRVICYFSAGSSENWRPDFGAFAAADQGEPLDDWPGERWLDPRSENVRKIMLARRDRARAQHCDGVDPDNVDGFANRTGFALQRADSVGYVRFLAREGHARGLAVGLKNGGDFAAEVVESVDWEVNEQCGEFGECAQLGVFVQANKPVFRIEYPPTIDDAAAARICGQSDTRGFSTLLKSLALDATGRACATD